MTTSFLLAPIPKWYIADLTGKPLGGGSMYTYRNLDKTQQKLIYHDPAGIFPWTDPVLFDENGSQGPFYWSVDSAQPLETYYIEVYDSSGVLQWTISDFAPSGGSGGGSIITTALNLDNLLANNVFWRHTGDTASPINSTLVTLAPSSNTGLVQTPSTSSANGPVGPDILFIKNNTAATDQIRFLPFTLGSNALVGDVTPPFYLNYTCSILGAGETYKYIQFPITQGVQNLSNQETTVTIWARGNSGTTTLRLSWLQFFGDGAGASTTVIQPMQDLTLTNAWTKFTIGAPSSVVPDVTGKVLGGCGNDGLFMIIQLPLSAICNIDLIKPSIYLGNIPPNEDYNTYDFIDSQVNTARTGDIRVSLNSFWPYGWVLMNDGTIGNASSNATTRKNIDTFPLFYLLWNSVGSTYAPMFDSVGTPIAYGASAIADFTANNQISLTKQLGRTLASAGTPSVGGTNWALGQFTGSETHTLSIAEMPTHNHPGSVAPYNGVQAGSGLTDVVRNAAPSTGSLPLSIASQGGGSAHSIMQPTSFSNVFIKL